MPEPPDDNSAQGPEVTNTASGNAKVDAQFGYVEGNVVYHKNETIYQVDPGASPDQKFKVARSHLEGGIPRGAEDLIGQVLDARPATTEIAYYYALSVLSERSLNQLGGGELDKLDRALRVAAGLPKDEWTAPLSVIRGLLGCVMPADGASDVPKGALRLVVKGLEAIPHQRRAEITRHLGMIFDGATQDEMDRINTETVATERKGANRADRAWKFFHPPPEKPRPAAPIPLADGQPRIAAWTAVVFGVGGFVGFLVLGVRIADQWYGLIVPMGVLLLGGLVAGRFGSLVLALRIRRSMKAFEENRFPESLDVDDEDLELKVNASLKFAATIRRQLDYYFTRWRPRFGKTYMDKDKWHTQTKRIKSTLQARLVRLYGTSKIPVSRLNWLIRWHAKQTSAQWKDNGTLPDFHNTLQPDATTILFLGGGLAIAGGGAIWLVLAAVQAGLVVTLIGLVEVIAGCVGGTGLTYVIADNRAITREHAELDQIFDDERREYVRWEKRLDDRPTDAEIGNWLDNDKSYLKAHAMGKCKLTNQDIIAHVVLAAGTDGAKRARVRGGPPRYSAYTVLVFLLSYNGVRQVEVDLNFRTGAIYDEQRRSFRYDALASAEVLEEGFQSAEGRLHWVRMDDSWHLTDKEALVIRRIFQLVLVHGQGVRVEVNNYEGLIDDSSEEDKTQLNRIALDSSGVAGALQILEAVAAEGREWIAKERERRNRHWQQWQDWRSDHLPDPALALEEAWPRGIGPAAEPEGNDS
jgi:hypothetical protein